MRPDRSPRVPARRAVPAAVLGLGAAAGIWGLTASVTVFALLVAAVCAVLAVVSLAVRLGGPR